MIALAVVLSVILGLGTIFICGAVMVKLRTDKLIVEVIQFNNKYSELTN